MVIWVNYVLNNDDASQVQERLRRIRISNLMGLTFSILLNPRICVHFLDCLLRQIIQLYRLLRLYAN